MINIPVACTCGVVWPNAVADGQAGNGTQLDAVRSRAGRCRFVIVLWTWFMALARAAGVLLVPVRRSAGNYDSAKEFRVVESAIN
jgi:hypothetical protein